MESIQRVGAAGMLENHRVLYKCKDYRLPLCELYFCRHCLKLRSKDCVSHEVDSHYCPNCMENMPSAEAKLKKNRCANCFDCPSCKHTLSTRATSVLVPSADDPNKAVAKKAYYLACAFCRWTSRDIGLKDQSVASGGWEEQENPNAQRISELVEYYKQVAQKEKSDRERKKYAKSRIRLLGMSGKYASQSARRHASLTSMQNLSLKEEEQKLVKITPNMAVEEVEGLPEDIYTTPINLAHITSIAQRLSQPDEQPTLTNKLYPIHKHLLVKRSLRCKECEHNLSKPEFNPASIKFKIQLVALHYVPELRILSIPNLYHLKESVVLLSLINPLEEMTNVTLLGCEEGDPEDIDSTAKIVLPSQELILSARDDAAEYDEGDNVMDFKDDPEVVIFRKANKISFVVKVTPMKAVGDVKIAFKMKYNYKNITTPLGSKEEKETPMVVLEHHVDVNLGQVIPS
ncbi:dynactin subunit 4-like isoform X6 [Branchiostoma floridae]|uniref:Dynactin subunit 4 n=1 Tax=Branchiostoma floridae TaxID=7739 RepID=A0A9J7KU11_BRAFL|nr:dynactin subunit 4-like isoform X6 [Branchiostoma floridae]